MSTIDRILALMPAPRGHEERVRANLAKLDEARLYELLCGLERVIVYGEEAHGVEYEHPLQLRYELNALKERAERCETLLSIKIGDRVKIPASWCDVVFTVLAIDGDFIWLRDDEGTHVQDQLTRVVAIS